MHELVNELDEYEVNKIFEWLDHYEVNKMIGSMQG